MKSILAVLLLLACLSVSCAAAQSPSSPEVQSSSQAVAKPQPTAAPGFRELDWDTYVDKVQGAWMGKMIGVTFASPGNSNTWARPSALISPIGLFPRHA